MHVPFLKQIARSCSARALPHKAHTNGAQALAALRERARRTAEARAPEIGGVCRVLALHEKKSWDWGIYTDRISILDMNLNGDAGVMSVKEGT